MAVIILDGIGINFKTSLISEFVDLGYGALVSDSQFYWGGVGDLFKESNKFTNKIQTRYMEMVSSLSVLNSVNDNCGLMVDRGITNQVDWCKINYDEHLDVFEVDRDDCKLVLDDIDKYIELEDKFNPIRILIETRNKELISKGLDDKLYDKDKHAAYRIDTFWNVDRYLQLQDEYISNYMDCMKTRQYDIVQIRDNQNISLEFDRVYNKINSLIKKYE
jgi:hypothetical protein